MIKNQWYIVMDSKEVKKNKLVGVTRFSEKLVFWRDNRGEVHCIFDQCCHRGASISEGKIVENHPECPFHGFQYDSSGKVVLIPANGKKSGVPENFKVNSYLVREKNGFIWIWYGEKKSAHLDLPFFEELQEGYYYGGFVENWNVHYSRAIENQLDVVHLPFVHKTTIGAGNKTLVNGPVVKWSKNRMTFYVDNQQDRGQTPKKPSEIDNYQSLFHLQLQMPNLWQNVISDKVRIVAAFVPIDEENSRIYLRFYQNFVKLPILRDLVGWMSNFSDKVIFHQDRKVVLTQLPKKSQLEMKENLIQGDLPIIEYRKKREELIRLSREDKDNGETE